MIFAVIIKKIKGIKICSMGGVVRYGERGYLGRPRHGEGSEEGSRGREIQREEESRVEDCPWPRGERLEGKGKRRGTREQEARERRGHKREMRVQEAPKKCFSKF